MKTYKVVSREVNTVDKVSCDRCKKDCYGELHDGDTNDFQLTWETTSIGDGPYHSVDVDLCFDCRVWLFKLLESEGVKLYGKDGDL
jgi:hypothetical protein